jgi:type VI secretion system protein ImpK
LFALATQLRTTSAHGDPASLSNRLAAEIKNFETTARASGEPEAMVNPARYALCTLLDEIVLSTPWGAESAYSRETLLIRFHREASGGEKFFRILQTALEDPAGRLHLIELLYVCMALGLEGRYKVQADGHRQLQRVMGDTYDVIRRQRGDFERELSPRWRGVQDQRATLARYVPLWAVAAIAAGVLLLIYIVFLYRLNAVSDPVVAQIATLGTHVEPMEKRAPAAPVKRATLAMLLAADEKEGLVEVKDFDDRSVVSLWGLFSSGEARIPDEQHDLLHRVAQALAQFPGRVSVLGHTDNQPVRSLRFPDNWSLSERRAEAVQRLLIAVLPKDRVAFEGKGDSAPLVGNDNAVNRAINRRVEIILYPETREL